MPALRFHDDFSLCCQGLGFEAAAAFPGSQTNVHVARFEPGIIRRVPLWGVSGQRPCACIIGEFSIRDEGDVHRQRAGDTVPKDWPDMFQL